MADVTLTATTKLHWAEELGTPFQPARWRRQRMIAAVDALLPGIRLQLLEQAKQQLTDRGIKL